LSGSSSPRSWGCFLAEEWPIESYAVFPTLVGVFPDQQNKMTNKMSLPHARGGVSFPATGASMSGESSPRSWGCFRQLKSVCQRSHVFPTLVGVFL